MGLIEKARSKQKKSKKHIDEDGDDVKILNAVLESNAIPVNPDSEVKSEFSDFLTNVGNCSISDLPPLDFSALPEGSMKTELGPCLWNMDPAKDMSQEDKEGYKTVGEYMYNQDYEKSDVDTLMKENVAYSLMCIRSGMNPRDLDEEEIEALEEINGPTWYTPLGFTEEEVYGDD
jgi:hypothetical protein